MPMQFRLSESPPIKAFQTTIYLPVLVGAVSKVYLTHLTPLTRVSDHSTNQCRLLHERHQSASARFAVGNVHLAQLVRQDQDLASENNRLDKSIVEAVSREPSKRNAVEEQQIRVACRRLPPNASRYRQLVTRAFPSSPHSPSPPLCQSKKLKGCWR